MLPSYDVIVVGAGHAGCEAASAAARLGSRVLLVTMNMNTIAQMSCNPAMGGVAKGQIVREIDAMGGWSGIVTDKTMIQFRMLNTSKGAAMWSPRAQSDRMRFAEEWRLTLEAQPNIDFWQDTVQAVRVEQGRITGVRTGLGITIEAKTVVITAGTFLNGIIHIGEKQLGGGRAAEKAATGITEQLRELGFASDRMKTGTPPRVDGRSLDYAKMEEQRGDEVPGKFSYTDTPRLTKQRSCWITYTNTNAHDILREGFEKSPMFQGRIKGLGPRYCPSIEDKINRFADRDRHQIFVEPEGWQTCEVYVNGFSSSLPEDVQLRALRQLAGFENARMFRPGYAIEYDFFPPTQLKPSLETKLVEGLFFAGQINGTTGYEEAACQGLMAGINASHHCSSKEPIVFKRNEAYIGVLIDDLVHKGTDEPYRMFTSRAEHRLMLRQDNADERLTPMAHQLGLVSDERMNSLDQKRASTTAILKWLNETSVGPEEVNDYLASVDSVPITQRGKVGALLKRPQVEIRSLAAGVDRVGEALRDQPIESVEQAEIQLKYGTYLEKEADTVLKVASMENHPLKGRLDYGSIKALSHEAREKLLRVQPETIGQARRIMGVSPADVAVLLIHLGR
jgi:tRNA uridine 5-carboxymethylaminomethyl modification enzyme